jgi:Cys-rich protein (TIGR01571 family)
VNNRNYYCCDGDPGETWSHDNEWFVANLLRFYLTGIWVALTLLTAVSVLFKRVKKAPPFPDAAMLPNHLSMLEGEDFGFKLCDCCTDCSSCCFVTWCDPVSTAEIHATAGTANFWHIYFWCVFACVFGAVVAAAAEIEARANIDIENYVRGLLLAVVMARKRQALRARLGQGETARKKCVEDFFVWWCCFCCAGIQEYRHVQAALPYAKVVPVGPPVQVQNNYVMPVTVVGAPVLGATVNGGATIVGQVVSKTQETKEVVAVVGTPVENGNLNHATKDNPNQAMEVN